MYAEIINFKATDGVVNDGYIIKNNSKKIIISIHGMSSNCFKDRDKAISKKHLKMVLHIWDLIIVEVNL